MKAQKDINGKLVLSDKQIDKAVQRIINKKKKHKTITFTMSINGKEVTVVKYRELIDLDKLSPPSRRKVVKRCVMEILQNNRVETIDGKIVTIRSTKGADKIHFQAKQKIVLFLDELIRNAIPVDSRIDYENNRIQWFYYDSYIVIDGVVYYWLINIRKIDGIYSFYDLNKRKEVYTAGSFE